MLSRLSCGSQDNQDGYEETVKGNVSELISELRIIDWMHIRESLRMKTERKKKGLLATIWESMTKTGGCCGPGEDCCGPAKESDKKTRENKTVEESNR